MKCPTPWRFPAGSWSASPSPHPMTPGSGAFSWGAESLCLAPASCQEGRRPLQWPFHTSRKNKPICKSQRWELGKWAGGEECPVPAEMVWEGWDPAPSLHRSRALLQSSVLLDGQRHTWKGGKLWDTLQLRVETELGAVGQETSVCSSEYSTPEYPQGPPSRPQFP